MMVFIVKDDGERMRFETGMLRSPSDGKPRFDLLVPESLPYEETMLYRWAMRMEGGARAYGDRNWEKSRTKEEYDRAKESAFRHFMQWFSGEDDEDHAPAVFANIQFVEYIKWRWEAHGSS
jgi:hypothetical protein